LTLTFELTTNDNKQLNKVQIFKDNINPIRQTSWMISQISSTRRKRGNQ
jgi:hypothetical protein